jgi:hypothetical protein
MIWRTEPRGSTFFPFGGGTVYELEFMMAIAGAAIISPSIFPQRVRQPNAITPATSANRVRNCDGIRFVSTNDLPLSLL